MCGHFPTRRHHGRRDAKCYNQECESNSRKPQCSVKSDASCGNQNGLDEEEHNPGSHHHCVNVHESRQIGCTKPPVKEVRPGKTCDDKNQHKSRQPDEEFVRARQAQRCHCLNRIVSHAPHCRGCVFNHQLRQQTLTQCEALRQDRSKRRDGQEWRPRAMQIVRESQQLRPE